MVRGPKPPESNPGDAPSGASAHELYDMGSIRHVMLEIGKLTSKVDRLIDDVKENTDRSSRLEKKISNFETTAKVLGAAFVVIAIVFWWALGDHIKTVVEMALKEAYSTESTKTPPSAK